MSWRVAGGAGAAATGAFALLILGCVFLAAAGPRESLAMRTSALRRQLAAVPAAGRSFELTADWFEFTDELRGARSLDGAGPGSASAGQLAALTRQAARDLAATPLPLGPRAADWAGLDTGGNVVAGAAASAVVHGTPPQLDILYRDPLGSYSRLLAGRYPRSAHVQWATPPHRGNQADTVTRATFEIAVAQATAARFGLHPGSRLTDDLAGPRVTLDITGVLRAKDPGSAFWTASPAAAPAFVPRTPASPAYWSAEAFAGPGELAAMQATFAQTKMQFDWDFPLDLNRLDADQVPALAASLDRAASRVLPLDGQVGQTARILGVAIPGPQQALSAFLGTQQAVQAILWLLFTGLAVIDAIAVLLAAQLMAGRRAAEFALIRARGAALWQIGAMALRDGGAIAVPAAAAGLGLAVLLTPGRPAALAWWLAGLTILAALACLPLAVVLAHRHVYPGGAAGSRELDRAATRRTSLRRWVAEGTLTAMAAGGLVVLREQGLAASHGLDAYPALAPVLIAVPAALLVMRLYPWALRGVLRLCARRAPVTWFMALTRAAWAGPVSLLPMFGLVLALVLASFAGLVRAAVARGETAASWQAVGADAVVASGTTAGGFTRRDERAIAAVRGVTHAAAIRVMTWDPPGGHPVQIAAVNPASYAAFVASTPWPRFPASRLAARSPARPGGVVPPVPAIVTPAARRVLGSGPATIITDAGPLPIRVAATLARTPAFPGSSLFVLVPWLAVRTPGGTLPPTEMLLAGPHLDHRQLTAVVRRVLPAATVAVRGSVLHALASAPLQHGTDVLFAAGIGAAAGLSAVILLLALSLGAQGRELTLTRLATMGLGARQARLAAMGEALPAVLAAAAAGAACAALLAELIGPALDLSVFTGSAVRVAIQPDLAALAVPALGLAALGVLTLAGEVTAARRRGLARALRMGG